MGDLSTGLTLTLEANILTVKPVMREANKIRGAKFDKAFSEAFLHIGKEKSSGPSDKQLLEDLASELGVAVIRRENGTVLVRAADVLRVIRAAASKGYWTLGLEGFYEKGRNLVPDMGCIADFSSLGSLPAGERESASIRDAELFLQRCADPQLLFEIILAE